ncbi:protein ELYS isoform X2 [Harpegnathos saltator]|uniref:protein ELYS isoform X2 n=1 Tax=Harpegnathos saltator TaxID=610380 RepID=UPI00058B141D|nr:protein ELYS isoform X2 [Harpegnathos saltator]
MCDLIDLNSPNVKDLMNSKLASPLIPVPRHVEPNQQANSLVTEKRESLGNNPFDSVLHETTEYIKKKGDPFEVVLQKALKSKSTKGTELKAHPVDFMDDFTPKRRRKYQKIMNKTLDESLVKSNMNPINEEKKETAISNVANNINVTCDSNISGSNKFTHKQNIKITVMDANPLELSILNQSAMNDTLLEGPKYKVDNEISIFLEKEPSFKEFVVPTSSNFKPPLNPQRSLSQGSRKSPRKLQCQDKRPQSITDTLRKASHNDSTMLSLLNKGFLENGQNQQSLFSDLSDVSSIAKLNSASLLSNLSSTSSNGIMNNAFIDSNCLKMSNEKINKSENSMEIKSVQYDLSDLTERLTKLKCAIDRTTSTLSAKEEVNKSNSMKNENNKQIVDNKLVDVDVFMPEPSSNIGHDKSTNSISSSDSVFTDSGKIDKSILNEAKVLAKTFEELALKTDSGSSTDDLISNNGLWMSELLPAYEDESVDNLIELLVSPKKNLEIDKSNNLKQSSVSDNVEENFMKEMESQFIDSISTVKQTTITTLLLDLKKLVKAEDNPEANKLINHLESALGIKCKSNMELLANLNIITELRNADMCEDKFNNIEQSDKSNDKNQKDNDKISEEKICDNESSLPHTSHEAQDSPQAATVSSDNSVTKTLLSNNDNEDRLNISNSPKIVLKNSRSDERLAIELLINLGKLLSGQAEDATTSQLLKSIGKTLNVASNNCKIGGKSQDDNSRNTQQVSPVKTSESELNVSVSSSKQTAHERSFNSKFTPVDKTKRRSISTTHSSKANISNTPVITKRRSTSELKDRKRFSNNHVLINTMANKKTSISGTSNTKIVETTQLESKTEKPLAITDVKNKLKKKLGTASNKGPMKAVHPVGTMQKKASLGKQTIPSCEATTPPKHHAVSSGNKIISSTPNSVASSTPDSQNNKSSKTLMPTNKKRNFSCDISPVTGIQKEDSPKRLNKPLQTTKKCTPKRQQADLSGIPKYCTPPRKLNSSLDMNSHHQQSPQYLNKSLTNYQRYSPIRSKSAEKNVRSPLKDSNKIFTKVRPFKLGNTGDFAEKENCSG